MMSERLHKLIAKIMNVPIFMISDDSGPEPIDSWTSFNGYVLLYELETEFNAKFTIDEAVDVKTVRDIKCHLKNHGIVLND